MTFLHQELNRSFLVSAGHIEDLKIDLLFDAKYRQHLGLQTPSPIIVASLQVITQGPVRGFNGFKTYEYAPTVDHLQHDYIRSASFRNLVLLSTCNLGLYQLLGS